MDQLQPNHMGDYTKWTQLGLNTQSKLQNLSYIVALLLRFKYCTNFA